MTIHRKSYRPYSGTLTPRANRYRVIADREIRLALGRSWVRRLLASSLLPLIGCVIFLYVRLVVERATQFAIWDGMVFETLYRVQSLFVMLLMAVVGSDLIAKDTAAGSHPLYFSRPLGTGQYLAGKLLSVAILLAMITVGPGVLLDLAQLLLATQADVGAFFAKLVQVVLYGLVVSFVGASIIAYMSSLGSQARYVGLGWVALYLLSDGLSSVLEHLWPVSAIPRLLSVPKLFIDAGTWLYSESSYGPAAFFVLVTVGAVCFVLLKRRVEALEQKEA